MNFNWDEVPQDFYMNLGKSGLKISKIIVGCMSFGVKKWADWVLEDEEKCFEVMKKCYDVGIRTFDTADVYSDGHAEVLLGKFIKKYNIPRDKIVIMTKVYHALDADNPGVIPFGERSSRKGHEYLNSWGLSRKHITDAVKASMDRLGTYIDLYQIHRFDPTTPIEETMEALHDCIKAGYTRYIGASSMKTYQFIMMQNAAEKHGWTKFVSMQSYYNLIYRHDEEELNAYCNLTGVGLIPWSPNARGHLTRPYGATSESNRLNSDSTMKAIALDNLTTCDIEIINRIEKIAKDKGVPMAAVATCWVLSKGCAPIVGLSSPKRVDDCITALKLTLSDEDIKYLEEAYVYKGFQ